MEEVYISNAQTGVAANPSTEDTQMEIRDLLLAPHEIALNGLSNVNIDNPTNQQTLLYNTSECKWENNNIPEGGQINDKGDLVSYDFTLGNLSTDGNWHSLDLSEKVPVGTTHVHLTVNITDSLTDRNIMFRKQGNVNLINIFLVKTILSNVSSWGSDWVACDENRVISYKTSNITFSSINIAIRDSFTQEVG